MTDIVGFEDKKERQLRETAFVALVIAFFFLFFFFAFFNRVELLTARKNPHHTRFKFNFLKYSILIYKILIHKLKSLVLSLNFILRKKN